MTREQFIKKWLGNINYQYTEQNRDLMRDDLDKVINESLRNSAKIRCTCPEEHRIGETKILCCNHCGLPVEDWWGKAQHVLAEVPKRDYEWVCNECNFPNLTSSVSEDEIEQELHACINCGCFEMHKRHFR